MKNPLDTSADTWSTVKKVSFRFCFSFFLLIIIFQNNGAFPFWDKLMHYPVLGLEKFIPWIGVHVLHLSYPIDTSPNGSGDTTYDWVILLSIFSTSILSCVAWSLLDRRRGSYKQLYYYLTLAIRFYVGLMLISYGLVKVYKLQFPAPYLGRLLQPYGESSPMGLAWTFLGFSKGYNLFMGIAEVSAVLLLFRRTMTLGAIITLMTTANVMAVNFFYDVPVKILSSILFLMTLFLLCFNASNLFRFFFTKTPTSLDRIAQPTTINPLFRKVAYAFKYLVIAYAVLYGGYECYQQVKEYGDDAPKFKYEGVYDVTQFIKNKDTLPPLLSDSTQWRRISIPGSWGMRIKLMNDRTLRLNGPMDTVNTLFWMDFQGDSSRNGMMTFKQIKDDQYYFGMRQQGDSIQAYAKRLNVQESFLLTNRGFHWVNEYPFNR